MFMYSTTQLRTENGPTIASETECSRLHYSVLLKPRNEKICVQGFRIDPKLSAQVGPQWDRGAGEKGFFIFRELKSTAYYFMGAGEQALTLGDLGSTAKK